MLTNDAVALARQQAGRRALHYAAWQGHTLAITTLTEAGAAVEAEDNVCAVALQPLQVDDCVGSS